TLPPEMLPEFMHTLSRARIHFTTRCLIEWQLHTMARPSEAAGARWDEIEWDEKLWRIPAERMKRKREHVVPLTTQMLTILEEMKAINGHGRS
ncbi:tyrosine-type recombinase/integrase, partial [Vibrio algivorus]